MTYSKIESRVTIHSETKPLVSFEHKPISGGSKKQGREEEKKEERRKKKCGRTPIA